MDSDLNCFWLHHTNPYLRLGPFKLELKNKQPEIAYVHDMVSETEMERIKTGNSIKRTYKCNQNKRSMKQNDDFQEGVSPA